MLDRDLTAPPGSPSDGDRYIVGSGATGDWAGWDLNVALWTDGAWLRLPPRTGWRAWIEDEGLLLAYDGATWIGTTPATLQNMALLGGGTTADASNPFSAKLNAALWTAKTVAEGGSGDLFYTMNKEAAGDDFGLTLQMGFVTKALVGLFGSDRFRLAVSADGSNFFDGLSVDNATGIVDQPRAAPRFSGEDISHAGARRISGAKVANFGPPPSRGALPELVALHLFDGVLFGLPCDVAGSGKSRGVMSTALMCARVRTHNQ